MGRKLHPRDVRVRLVGRTTKNEMVSFTPEKLNKFREAYLECVDDTDDIFEFEGNQYVCGYAKHMIEYLEGLWLTDDRTQV